jgi:hypothetical protein
MNKTGRTNSKLMTGAVLVLVGVACTSGVADEVLSEGDQAPAPDLASGDAWTAASTSGVEVSVSADPLPLRPGPVRLEIALGEAPPDVLPLSLDLVSPEMPMHGIVRYETEASSVAHYRAVVDIPMEGLWELYVNLDYGADAAVFELDVAAPEGSTGHEHHGGAPSTEAGPQHDHRNPGGDEPSDAGSEDEHRHHASPGDHSGTTASDGLVDPGSHGGHGPR